MKGNCYHNSFNCEDCCSDMRDICNDLVNYSDVGESIIRKRYNYVVKKLIELGHEDIIFEELL